MAKRKGIIGVEFSKRFWATYDAVSHDRQKGVDKAIVALMKQEPTPGLRVKPIQPEKFYSEARVNDGDRLVHRIGDDRLWIVDLVVHDDIARYGRRVSGLFQ